MKTLPKSCQKLPLCATPRSDPLGAKLRSEAPDPIAHDLRRWRLCQPVSGRAAKSFVDLRLGNEDLLKCGKGEMALEALEKPPFGAIFHRCFDEFLGVFLRAFPSGRKWARLRPRKARVLNHAGSTIQNVPQALTMPEMLKTADQTQFEAVSIMPASDADSKKMAEPNQDLKLYRLCGRHAHAKKSPSEPKLKLYRLSGRLAHTRRIAERTQIEAASIVQAVSPS
jgi:hypothetical protein